MPRLKESREASALAAGVRSNRESTRGDRRNSNQKTYTLTAEIRSNWDFTRGDRRNSVWECYFIFEYLI